jgi:hypothetical protein
MATEFKLIFEGQPDIDLQRFQQSLPDTFAVQEKKDGIYVAVESDSPEDERCQYLIERELDRHFFLTCVKIRAAMVRKTVTSTLPFRRRVHGALPADIKPQIWTYHLPIQLRLWATAVDTSDLAFKILLLYQIIEIAYPDRRDYPEYNDPSTAPHPLSECKFMRDLIAHSGAVSSKQLKVYCKHLGLREVMHDVTDPHYTKVIASKAHLMEAEARRAIEKAL